MKNLVIGITAHVDAGKTTLSEALLYTSGTIKNAGRVDKRDSFLDTYSLERERGITIFSKQAIIEMPEARITLVDTPGHIDFSCEAERALSVQDYAILVISAGEGATAHTKTLWRLLRARNIPIFIFVNKTDISDKGRREICNELRASLSPAIADFSTESAKFEDCAGADEELMAEYFDTGALLDESITKKIAECKLFPTFFGSALKMIGIKDFLTDILRYTRERRYPERLFGATVYKIARDKAGKRLTYMKITGGVLSAKDNIKVTDARGEVHIEKVEEIRLYSADKFKSVKDAKAGTLCAVLGLEHTTAGMGLGTEPADTHTLTPVLDYKMILPDGVSVYETYLKLTEISEEDPSLSISYSERAKEIRVRLMGEIQLEVLKRLIDDRLGIKVEFGEGAILYKETVADEVIGSGHFEPLRHYAEVHLRIEPLPEGSGIVTDSECSQDVLLTNWQRLIISHIEERTHKGVLIGAPLTDVKITLIGGRAHQKHTEGGDFRQATYRAIRQGLMKARSVLLEPTFNFTIELPTDSIGRCMMDIEEMGGTAEAPEIFEDTARLSGNCPVETMRSYAVKLRAYTRGAGKLALEVGPYKPCKKADEVITAKEYSPALDERNTPNSVFCKNGSGYVVPWNEADELMHVKPNETTEEAQLELRAYKPQRASGITATDEELMKIFEATYGKIKPRTVAEKVENAAPEVQKKAKGAKGRTALDSYVIIDGYNLIFAWEFLRKYADADLSLAREIIVRMMCNYTSFYKCRAIVVFDAYKRPDVNNREESHHGRVLEVYTKEGETADAYIERKTAELAPKNNVRVVTSDYTEQLMVLGSGGLRVSSREFILELEKLTDDINEIIGNIR